MLKALKKDSATTGIAVVVLSGLSHKNAERLQQDGACAFLEKAELGLDKKFRGVSGGAGTNLQELNLEVPKMARARGA